MIPDRLYKRMRLCAALSILQAAVVAAALVGLVPLSVALPIALLAVLPVFWAGGQLQALVALNPELDDADRARWRTLVACVPGGIALYWYRHLR